MVCFPLHIKIIFPKVLIFLMIIFICGGKVGVNTLEISNNLKQ